MTNIPEFNGLDPQSRVWIYQANRNLTDEEVRSVQQAVNQFTGRWVSHNRQLKAAGKILHQRFLVLVADETHAGASGCSIDSSVHFINDLGGEFGISFFDRLTFPYRKDGNLQFAPKDVFEKLYAAG